MAEWKTRAWRHDDLEKPSEDTVTVEEAEAKLAGQAAAYNALAERLDAKLAAATRYPHCDSEPDGLCLLEKAEARIAALEEKEARAVLALVEGGKRIAALEAARDKALETAEEFRVERDKARAKLAAAHKALEENLEQQNERGSVLATRIAALEKYIHDGCPWVIEDGQTCDKCDWPDCPLKPFGGEESGVGGGSLSTSQQSAPATVSPTASKPPEGYNRAQLNADIERVTGLTMKRRRPNAR